MGTDEEINPMVVAIGPFYDTAGAMFQLGGLDEESLRRQRESGTILAMQTGDGTWLYPAWQFDGQGFVDRRLLPALVAMVDLGGWSIGMWLNNPREDLGGRSPRAALRVGVPPDQIASLAAEDARRLKT